MCARAVARRGLQRGLRSPEFSLADLVLAAHTAHKENVYVEVSSAGELSARGGAARVVAAARLAPAPPLASALLSLASTAPLASPAAAPLASPAAAPLAFPLGAPLIDARLRLRLVADVAPLQELQFWFDEYTLALLDMPFLTLRNITGHGTYACHVCGAEYEFPNPLKVHLLLGCAPASPVALWARLAAAAGVMGATAEAGARRAGAGARLEALAAAAGRGAGGHACVFCGKLYSRRYGLKIHIRTHTGYKPLRCRHCLRAFGDPSNLNKHVRLHEAAAPRARRNHTRTRSLYL